MIGYDLSGLMFNFELVPNGMRIVDYFSDLKPFKEFHIEDERRIKIATLLGDIDSPFVRIKDRETMIKTVFEYLEIDTEKEEKLFKDIIAYKDDQTMFAWLRYIQILHETDFTNWLISRRDYDFFLTNSHEEKKPDEKEMDYYKRRNEARSRIRELGEEVKKIEGLIFPDSKAAREAAIAESKRKIFLFAEKYAQDYNYV